MKIAVIPLILLGEILIAAAFPFSGIARGKGREVVLKLKPGSNNPRNSEGDFVTLKDGRLLFVYTHLSETDLTRIRLSRIYRSKID